MNVKGKNIGFALTGSFGYFNKTIEQINKLIKNGANVYPIMSFNSYKMNTKFGKADEFKEKIIKITGNKIISTIEEAEFIGKKKMFDILVVSPCSRKYYF